MSSFNSQYEEYYSRVNRGRRDKRERKEKKPRAYRIGARLIRDLFGVLVLFLIVISCRAIETPETQAVYKYSKAVLNKTYNYNEIKNSIYYFKEKLKTKVPDIDKFIKPVQGTVTSTFGERNDPVNGQIAVHKGIDINASENTNILAAFNGKVKSLGDDKSLGKYIIIDHGNGAETKYGHLNTILVNKGDAVMKGDVIAKSGNTGKSTGPHLHFELLYMGENINPEVIR